MEFFRIIETSTNESLIQELISLDHLEKVSNQIFSLSPPAKNEANIGGIWGEFTLTRSEIKGGLRFALLECPNALCWTITTGYPPAPDSIVLHLTINRQQKDPEFLEEIEEFLDDHCECLKLYLSPKQVTLEQKT